MISVEWVSMGSAIHEDTYPAYFGAWLNEVIRDLGVSNGVVGRAYADTEPLGARKGDLRPDGRSKYDYASEIGRWRKGKGGKPPGALAAFRLGAALLSLGADTCGVQTMARALGDDESYFAQDETDAVLWVLKTAAVGFADIEIDRSQRIRWDKAFRHYRSGAKKAHAKYPIQLITIFNVVSALGRRVREDGEFEDDDESDHS